MLEQLCTSPKLDDKLNYTRGVAHFGEPSVCYLHVHLYCDLRDPDCNLLHH